MTNPAPDRSGPPPSRERSRRRDPLQEEVLSPVGQRRTVNHDPAGNVAAVAERGKTARRSKSDTPPLRNPKRAARPEVTATGVDVKK
jgi:hypothetical protein